MAMSSSAKGYFRDIKDDDGNVGRHIYIRDGRNLGTAFRDTVEECDKLYDDISLFKARPDDIWICAFVKSGTHWLWEIVSMLLTNTAELIKEPKESFMLDNNDAEALESVPSPRILNSHFDLGILPAGMWTSRNKVIHPMRNLKDILVSYYHHKVKLGSYKGTFSAFLDLYHEEVNGTWYAYEREWWTAHKDNPDVLFLKYEDMIKDHMGTIRKIAHFLSIPSDEELFQGILAKTTLTHMKKNKTEHGPQKRSVSGVFYRKGKVGDWKNFFTVTKNEEFDKEYAAQMKHGDLQFDFE